MKETLNKIKRLKVPMFKYRMIEWKYVNISYFPFLLQTDIYDFKKYKKIFEDDINKKRNELLKIQKENISNPIILKEIEHILIKMDFNLLAYNIEASKIDTSYKYNELPNYDFYSKEFFGTKFEDIIPVNYLPEVKEFNIFFSKTDVLKLLLKVTEMMPEFKFEFSSVPNFVYNKWTIFITDKDNYNIQEIITLFFHEMTHFIRWYNMKKNLWFLYVFVDNYELEEWLALYNEHFYWNQIINYWEYYPYYHKIYNILFKKQNIDDKLEQVEEILAYKWFSKEKSKMYFYRFYRFAPLWWEKMLLKEVIYYNSLNRVKELLNKWVNLDYLMSMKWGLTTIKHFMQENNLNNFDYKKYFETMVNEIKKLLLK